MLWKLFLKNIYFPLTYGQVAAVHGEVEGDAPHDDQSELEPLHLPRDRAAAPRGRPVLQQGETMLLGLSNFDINVSKYINIQNFWKMCLLSTDQLYIEDSFNKEKAGRK